LIGHRPGLLGVQPPHQPVLGGVSVCVFDHGLGLADAAHAVHRVHGDRRLFGQYLAKPD
jgi:hypothetical protein